MLRTFLLATTALLAGGTAAHAQTFNSLQTGQRDDGTYYTLGAGKPGDPMSVWGRIDKSTHQLGIRGAGRVTAEPIGFCDTGAWTGFVGGGGNGQNYPPERSGSPILKCRASAMSMQVDLPFVSIIGLDSHTGADGDQTHAQWSQFVMNAQTAQDQSRQENAISVNFDVGTGRKTAADPDGDYSEKTLAYLAVRQHDAAGGAWVINDILRRENGVAASSISFNRECDQTNFDGPSNPFGFSSACNFVTMTGFPGTAFDLWASGGTPHDGINNSSLGANTTAGSTTIMVTSSHGLSVDDMVTDPNGVIPPWTYIVSINGDTKAINQNTGTVVLSKPATATATGVAMSNFTFQRYHGLVANGATTVRDTLIINGTNSEGSIRTYNRHRYFADTSPSQTDYFWIGNQGQQLCYLSNPDACWQYAGGLMQYSQNGGRPLEIVGNANGVNGLQVASAAAGFSPTLSVTSNSPDANRGLNLAAKGAGNFYFSNSAGGCTLTPGAGGGLACSSDARLKEDVVDTGPALPRLLDMQIRDYTVKATGERKTGVIAQELQQTHPEMVSIDAGGTLAVEAPNPWVMVKAIQELKADNDVIRAQADAQVAIAAAVVHHVGAQLRMTQAIGGVLLVGTWIVFWPRRRRLA